MPEWIVYFTNLFHFHKQNPFTVYSEQMSSLPTEIITDILSRQPVKTLLRFRCVSKPWCSLIDGLDFIKLHLERSIQTCSHTNLIIRHEEIYSLNISDDSQEFVKLDHPLKSSCYDTELLGSCNGLVCLCNTENEVVLWNPYTRKHHVLPVFSILSGYKSIVFGFGYDRVNDDYKVLRIAERPGSGRDGDSSKSQVVVYSLKFDTWRKIDDFPYELCYRRECGFLVSGALHYMGSSTSNPEIQLIVAFDLDVERYRLVPIPERVGNNFLWIHLGVLGGCLSVISNLPGTDINIWVMKDYGTKVWTKLVCISPEVICSNLAFVSPLAYSKNGDAVLLGRELPESVKLFWYDLEKKILKKPTFRGVPKSFEASTQNKSFVSRSFVGSLVPLKGGSGIGKKQQLEPEERKKKKNGKKRDDFLSTGFKLVL